jgi:hypothetical protein
LFDPLGHELPIPLIVASVTLYPEGETPDTLTFAPTA